MEVKIYYNDYDKLRTTEYKQQKNCHSRRTLQGTRADRWFHSSSLEKRNGGELRVPEFTAG